MQDTAKHFIWADIVRIVAIVSVIIIHTSFQTLLQIKDISYSYWLTANIFNSCARFCVPLFLMLSGVLVFNLKYPTAGEFLKKRFSRILLPFVFWTLVYILLKLAILYLRSGYDTFIGTCLPQIYGDLLHGPSYQFWFIYMLIGLYLFFPIIRNWICNAPKKEIEYFLILWLLTLLIAIPAIKNNFPDFNLIYFSGYIGFPVAGYYFSHFPVPFTKSKILLLSSLIFTVSTLISIIGTTIYSYSSEIYFQDFHAYLSLNVAAASIAGFLFIKTISEKRTQKLPKILDNISKFTYGIYFCHVLFIDAINKIHFPAVLTNPIVEIPVKAIFTLAASLLLMMLLNKIPYARKLI